MSSVSCLEIISPSAKLNSLFKDFVRPWLTEFL